MAGMIIEEAIKIENSIVFKDKLPLGRQLTDIFVEEEKYNRWITNCNSNKSNSSWIYFYGDNQPTLRRKVKLIKCVTGLNEFLIYYGINYKYREWGILKKEEVN